MASLDDILSAQKNGVVNLANIVQANLRGQGTATSNTVDVDTIIITGKGYLVRFCVIDGGSADGAIHNASATVADTAANQLCVIPQTAGIYDAGLVFTNGLKIVVGTGQKVNVTYYVG